MSQQGIFRIASGGQGGVPSPSAELNGDNTSPFQIADEDEPVPAAVEDEVYPTDFKDSGRPEEVRGEPFQINGFPQRSGHEAIEAAPVAPVRQADAHAAYNDLYVHGDYEAATAILEPQQDFAALPARIGAALSSASHELSSQAAGEPAETIRAHREQAPPQSGNQVPSPVASRADNSANGEIQQLELRAIFGVDHILDLDEILQRARIMPGIRNVVIVEKPEAEAISNFRRAMERMGFGDPRQMKLNTGSGSVDFITEGKTTLATLLEGPYAPGVKETLIIVAREIGKLT